MKTILVIALIAPLILAAGYTDKPCSATQSEYKYKCVENSCFNTYIPRFKTVANAELVGGVGRIPITFQGYVEFVTGTGDVKVSVQFTDVQADGLAKRDNTKSCLESKLIRYGTINYENGLAYDNTITSSFDTANLYRQWSWTIKGADLKTVLVQDNSQPGYITFRGYFGLQFLVVDEVQVAYYFTFTVKLNSDMKTSIDSSFKGLVEKASAVCNPSGTCIAKADSSIAFCNKPDDCATTTPTKALYLNQNFGVIQKITTPGFQTYFLKCTGVTYTGEGLSRKVSNFSQVQSAGQVIVTVPVEFVYTGVSVTLVSELRTIAGRRVLVNSKRLLATTGSDVVVAAVATTQQTTCIKTSETATECPTCAEYLASNALPPECKHSGIISFLAALSQNSGIISVLAILVVLLSLI